jgi:hypothetical protein
MPSRRQFIQAGIAASVVPIALPMQEAMRVPVEAAAVMPSFRRPLCVVFDSRSPHSVDLAHEAERLGLTVVRTNGDITHFWFNELSPRWKRHPFAIAGLTSHGPLFCLERFGWDHGLRVAFRGEHRLLDSGQVEHALSGPVRTVAAAQAALTGDDWPAHVARLLHSCVATEDTAATTVRSSLAREHRNEIDDTLHSWVIAPKSA